MIIFTKPQFHGWSHLQRVDNNENTTTNQENIIIIFKETHYIHVLQLPQNSAKVEIINNLSLPQNSAEVEILNNLSH